MWKRRMTTEWDDQESPGLQRLVNMFGINDYNAEKPASIEKKKLSTEMKL
jgi:hypothetical protein